MGDALTRPGVVLCPPLTLDTPEPSWHGPLARRLAALDVPLVRPARAVLPRLPGGGQVQGPGVGQGPIPEQGPGHVDGPVHDRMTLAAWVADQAVAITAAGVDRPLILVAAGPAAAGLPALGFSQRASRRSVLAYVVVDGPLPRVGPATGDWPDAPVVCVAHAADAVLADAMATGARLRGWRVVHEDPISALTDLVTPWPDVR